MRRLIALALLGVWLTAATARADDGPSASTVAATMNSVVQVIATGCSGGGTSQGTGFVYHDTDSVATALHVVAGCQDVRVFFERPAGQPYRPAHVIRVRAALDLALLHLDGPASAEPLAGTNEVQPHAALRAIGYIENQPSMEELPASVSVGLATLRDFLPSPLQTELERTNPGIDMSGRIVRLVSPLDPGMSGGPIIDASGHVVAVVGGGLPNMPAPPSWGWPASGLQSLMQSTENPTLVASRPSQALRSFAPAASSDAVETRQCGQLAFTLVGQRQFRDISATADDPVRLDYVVRASTLSRDVVDALKFDVWRNGSAGAAVVVPHGADLVQQQGYCTAVSSNGAVTVTEAVYGQPVADLQALALVSAQFEFFASAPYGMVVQQDIPLTTPGTQVGQWRPDGLTLFNRKGALKMRQTPFGPRFAHLFETMLARGNTFIGIMTVEDPYSPFPQQCRAQPALPPCQQARSAMATWAPFVLATQLSTFPAY